MNGNGAHEEGNGNGNTKGKGRLTDDDVVFEVGSDDDRKVKL